MQPGIRDEQEGKPNSETSITNVRLALVLLCLLGIILETGIALSNRSSWHVDYNQFFVASKLAGTGQLYNWDLLRHGQNAYHETAVPTGRLPVFAAAFKVISGCGYTTGRILWAILCTLCAVSAVAMWPGLSRRVAVVVACWSMPLIMTIAFGQDSALILFFCALGVLLLMSGRSFAAGLVFSCILLKFHLTAGIIILLLARREWRAIGGGVVGLSSVIVTSFLIEGFNWPSRWLAMAKLPLFDPAPERMPNLRGLLDGLPNSVALYIVATALAALGMFWVARRAPLGVASAISLAVGLLCAPHAYAYDVVLLIPLIAYAITEPNHAVLTALGVFAASPLPSFLLLTDRSGWGQIAIVAFVVFAMVALTRRHAREQNRASNRSVNTAVHLPLHV